ncbi:Origin recognition complex subunit 3 [Marasmius sp. AFHP31]|nr:Origin recognition complex subunit 3 [Marasmius sp. AFHP31]
MTPNLKLNDVTQSVIFIPHTEAEEEEDFEEDGLFSESETCNLPNGEDTRWNAYRAAWTKCLNRVQDIVKEIYEPVVSEVVESVINADQNEISGLPYPELPAITITSPSPSPAFTQHVTELIKEEGKRKKFNCYITHLFPAECVNMTAMMKALITGFTTQATSRSQGYKGNARALASYDIKVLEAWSQDLKAKKKRPKLVVTMHDFELFDSALVQDFLYICSLYSQTLPLVFIICLSSPEAPTYLHATYPRSTLALLRIRQYVIPSGIPLLERICLETFASPDYEPDLVLGQAVIESLVDHFVRYDSSVDSLVNNLQLAHLKHFSVNPLTLLHHDTPSLDSLEDPSSLPFLETLLSRLEGPVTGGQVNDWQLKSVQDLAKAVDTARDDFYAKERLIMLAFNLMYLFQEFVKGRGYSGIEIRTKGDFPRYLRLYIKVLRGDVDQEIAEIERMTKLFKAQELTVFLGHLKGYLESLPEDTDTDGARQKVEEFNDTCSTHDLFAEREDLREIAIAFAKWFSSFVKTCMKHRLEDSKLWEIWFTRNSPFPSETQSLNPSVRTTIISGLLRPKEFVSDDNRRNPSDDEKLAEYSDTSILFRRYLDSGKMINVYDWFDSFHAIAEGQRKELKERRMAAALEDRRAGAIQVPETPSKRNSTKKNRKEKVLVEAPPEEDDEEKWNIQVQARFTRALHELDCMGFVKHTRRKQDSVLRTVFDVAD